MTTRTRDATALTVLVIMLLTINGHRAVGMRILAARTLENTTPGHSPGIGHNSYIDQTSAAQASLGDQHKFNSPDTFPGPSPGNSHP